MSSQRKSIGILPFLALVCAAEVPAPIQVPRIPFAPRHYIVQRTDHPPVLTGRMEDPAWGKAAWTEDFVDIEGPSRPAPRFRTRAKLLWDDQCLYIAAELEEPDVWAYQTERDCVVFQDNDFEIFIDPDGSTSPYYEFEMNARNTVWDLLLLHPYREPRGRAALNGWDIHGLRTATAVRGTLNRPGDVDRGWTLEVAMPWSALTEVTGRAPRPRAGDRWRLNFSRVEWHTQVKDGRTVKVEDGHGRPLPEDNWVWSPQGMVDMHAPEMWGFVQFSSRPAGAPEDGFALGPADAAQWVLRRIYYAQRALQARGAAFGATLGALGMNEAGPPKGWILRLEAGTSAWTAEVREEATGAWIRIDTLGCVTHGAGR